MYLDDSTALINISSTNVFRFFTSNYGPPLLNYSSDDVSKTLWNSRSHSVFVFFRKLLQDFIHSVNTLSHDLIHSVITQAFLFPKKIIFLMMLSPYKPSHGIEDGFLPSDYRHCASYQTMATVIQLQSPHYYKHGVVWFNTMRGDKDWMFWWIFQRFSNFWFCRLRTKSDAESQKEANTTKKLT